MRAAPLTATKTDLKICDLGDTANTANTALGRRQAIGMAPVPAPGILCHKPHVLALAALRGTASAGSASRQLRRGEDLPGCSGCGRHLSCRRCSRTTSPAPSDPGLALTR